MMVNGADSKSFYESPLRLIVIVFISIAIADSLSETVVLSFLPPFSSHLLLTIFKAVFLVVVLSPMLYFFLFRPMFLNINKRKHAEEALRSAHDELEVRISERTAELQEAHEQLRNLTAHLQSVREDERATIAHEIHDELGQVLTALKMNLSLITSEPPKNDWNELTKQVRAATDIVTTTIQTINRICTELRPSLLDYLGLGAALEWQAGEFQKKSGIQCEVVLSAGVDGTTDRDIAISLFRIFQEALSNVLRHAKATKVRATLTGRDNAVVLEVADDGIGITEEQLSKPGSFGLLVMRERVHTWGGQLTISGIHNEGTMVKVSIPVKSEKH